MKQHALDTNHCTDSECADRVAKQKIRVDLAQMHRWFNYTTDYWDMMKDFARRSSLERQFFTYDEMCDRPQARGATSNLRRATLPPRASPFSTLPSLTLPPPPCTTQEIANDLFRFLRLEPWRVNTSHTSQTLKTGGAVMRDSIENADEVASVLKGTVFEGQVDEEFASWRATAAQ
jgi:hypothetical protein